MSRLIIGCQDSDGNPTFTITETDDQVTFKTNFYLTVVSPDPLFLTTCDGGQTDCGRYLTYVFVICLLLSKKIHIDCYIIYELRYFSVWFVYFLLWLTVVLCMFFVICS